MLEKDCSAILQKTESQLHQSIRSNARMARLRHCRNWNIAFWVLGLLCLGLYVAMQFVDGGRAMQKGANVVWKTLYWMNKQSAGLLPAFSVLLTVKWVVSLCMIHGGILLVLQLLMGCCNVPSKEKLGQLQSNRKGLKAMMSYREELYNQYIKFWIVCYGLFLLFAFPCSHNHNVHRLYCCLFHSLKQPKTDSLARSAPKSLALFIKTHLHPYKALHSPILHCYSPATREKRREGLSIRL